MNYTVVITSAVWGGSLLYYFVDARKWFTGPKITVDTSELTEAQQKAIIEDGLEVEGLDGVVRGQSIEKEGSGSAIREDDKDRFDQKIQKG